MSHQLTGCHRFDDRMPFFFVVRFPNFDAELRIRYGSNLKQTPKFAAERKKIQNGRINKRMQPVQNNKH